MRIWHPRTFITQKHVKFFKKNQVRCFKLEFVKYNFNHIWSKGRAYGGGVGPMGAGGQGMPPSFHMTSRGRTRAHWSGPTKSPPKRHEKTKVGRGLGNLLVKCCNCRVLDLVLSSVPCPIADVPCGNDCAHSFSVEEIGVFQACLVENPSIQVVRFENHAEWRFCLATFVCRALLAHWRLVGAVALGWAHWRPSVLSLPLVFSPCVHARFC